MKQEFLLISGMTKADRHQVTSDINDAVSATGGWVVDHTLFSNMAITIQCVLLSRRLDEFRRRIVAASVQIDDDSNDKIQAMVRKHALKPIDVTASLNIAFIHNEPDLRREIPSVPG